MKSKVYLIGLIIITILALAVLDIIPISRFFDGENVTAMAASIIKEDTSWEGIGNKRFELNVKEPPSNLIIYATNAPEFGYITFSSTVCHQDNLFAYGCLGLPYRAEGKSRVYSLIQQGKYTVIIESSGCKWYAKLE